MIKRARVGEESPKPASTPTGAVFLSYASQDAEAAQRICEALRTAGIEVWFDQSELRGGDAWDQHIRERIHDCRLFIAVISGNTEARDEGYFRREWKLAVERTHDMDEKKSFLVPVVIDDTTERAARVPEKFHGIQWTRLPAGETSPSFVDRVRRLLSPGPSLAARPVASAAPGPGPAIQTPALASWWSKSTAVIALAVAVLVALAYFAADKFWVSKHFTASPAATAAPSDAAAFSPPQHSIAVLPFVNMSGDKDQEYFSDGVTEELITTLAQVNSLKVIARTSAFAFKGQNVDIGTIARKLNVGSILEGSVRRSGPTVRVTVQLIDASTGFHLWSQDYDRDVKNMLALQTDIALAVAQQLKARLNGDEASKIALGDTQDPDARDEVMRARKLYEDGGANELDPAIKLVEDATRRDPTYARAWGSLAWLYTLKVDRASGVERQPYLARAKAAADTALRIAPRWAGAHARMAWVYAYLLDWPAAIHEVEAAKSLDPRDPYTLNAAGNLAFQLGHWQEAIDAAKAGIPLDPLDAGDRFLLAAALYATGQYRESERVLRGVLALWPHQSDAHAQIALAMLRDRRPEEALPEAEREPDEWSRNEMLAMIYHALGRHSESDRILAHLEELPAGVGPFDVAMVHASRGETDPAFKWLDRALAERDPSLFVIKGNLGVWPTIAQDPRYAAALRKIGLPP
jgi:TolB-like protein